MLRNKTAFLLFLVLLAACVPSPYVVDRRDTDRYWIEFQDVASNSVTRFNWEVGVNAPAWRTWNVFMDVREAYRLTGSYDVLGEPQLLGPAHIRFVLSFKPHWYWPAITSVVEARIRPRDLAVECECAKGGDLEDCYFYTTVHPGADSEHSVIRMNGYLRRPFVFAYHASTHLIERDISTLPAGFDYKVQKPQYAVPDARYPWTDYNALAAGGNGAAAANGGRKFEVALQRFDTYGAADTVGTLASLAGDYLAAKITGLGTFEVVTSDDMNLMVRYLGERWALMCGNEDACNKRVADVMQVDYLLTGGLRTEEGNYEVHLALLDASRGRVAWRYQQTTGQNVLALKRAMDAAAESLRAIAPTLEVPVP